MSTVLVIDDEPEILENVVDLLTVEGYDPIATVDAIEGLQLAQDRHPDLILCDVMMPELTGHDILQRVRTIEELQTTPFIFLTARSTPDDVREGMSLGADDYLTKPFGASQLIEAVEARLERHRAFRQQREKRMDELRENVSAALPHEMRTPLVAIQGYAEVLQSDWDELSPQTGREMLGEILQATDRLTRLTENYVLYTQLETSTEAGLDEEGTTAMQSLVPEVVAKRADAYHRVDDVQHDLAPGRVMLSARYARPMVTELVDNALKFSSAGALVHITGTTDAEMYRLCVSDEGEGMSTDQVEQLGAFMQFDRSAQEQQGTGLGLALIHRICDRSGGTVDVTSTPGEGTTVEVALPLAGDPNN
jgi:signal transduction histidine kinase